MLDYEIEAFGRRLGLDALAFSPEGVVRLDIENIGSVYVEKSEQGASSEILVYLAAPVPAHDEEAARRLLELCDYRRGYALPVFAGVFSGRAVLLTRMPEASATAASLENALRFLAELLHETLRS